MMSVPPSEARGLSLYEYESLLWNWNDAHSRDEADAPEPEMTMVLLDRINSDERLIH